MTIKIQAYQKYGIKTKELVDEYEFCCWQYLLNWLKGFGELNKCSKCIKRSKIGKEVKTT